MKRTKWIYSSVQLDKSARNLAIYYWFMMSVCWSSTTFSCGFLLLFLIPCEHKQETLSAALMTHMVQWAVGVGEVKSFQAVGLTQEVVEMLKVKNSTKLALYPWCSFSGGVKYGQRQYSVIAPNVFESEFIMLLFSRPWLHAEAFCQIANGDSSYQVKIRSRSYSKWC